MSPLPNHTPPCTLHRFNQKKKLVCEAKLYGSLVASATRCSNTTVTLVPLHYYTNSRTPGGLPQPLLIVIMTRVAAVIITDQASTVGGTPAGMVDLRFPQLSYLYNVMFPNALCGIKSGTHVKGLKNLYLSHTLSIWNSLLC